MSLVKTSTVIYAVATWTSGGTIEIYFFSISYLVPILVHVFDGENLMDDRGFVIIELYLSCQHKLRFRDFFYKNISPRIFSSSSWIRFVFPFVAPTSSHLVAHWRITFVTNLARSTLGTALELGTIQTTGKNKY